ncbi:MAG: hypothetical protein ACLU38_04185 [Dysosmobacter sp.]
MVAVHRLQHRSLTATSHSPASVSTDGTLHWYDAYCGSLGLRPACYLDSDLLISIEDDEATDDGHAGARRRDHRGAGRAVRRHLRHRGSADHGSLVYARHPESYPREGGPA